MPSSPKVSILIPVYNREDLIEETVNSALAQTYQDFEIIVVDNNSTDHTFNLLKKMEGKFDKLHIYQNKDNIGPVKNWKKCLDYSNGEFIKILYSDDLMHRDFLAETVPVLENGPDIAFVYSKVCVFSDDFEYEKYSFGATKIYPISEFIERTIAEKGEIPVSPSCFLFRKKDVVITWEIDNKFEIDFNLTGAGPDLLIILNVAKKYDNYFYFNEVLARFRKHTGSITMSNNLRTHYLLAKARFLEKNGLIKLKKSLNLKILINEICKNKKVIVFPRRILRKYYVDQKYASCSLWYIFYGLFKQFGLLMLARVLKLFRKSVS